MLASLYLHLKRFDDVIKTLEDKAPPENRPGMPHEWLLLAMSYWHLGEKAKAEEYYEKVISGWAAADTSAIPAPERKAFEKFLAQAQDLFGK